MKKELTFKDMVRECLRRYPDKAHTSREIVELIIEYHKDYWHKKKKRGGKPFDDDEKEKFAQVQQEVTARGYDLGPNIKVVSSPRPRRYQWCGHDDEKEHRIEDHEKETLKEEDLYEPLRQYLGKSSHRIYSKRINERKRSSKKR